MPDEFIKNFTSVVILFMLFVIFHSIFKRQSFMASLKDIKNGLKELFESE